MESNQYGKYLIGGSQLAMIPKYSLMGPFRGHMSIKSSPFSPSSSCKLSSQYIVEDHMATHYRKLLSAKATVDSSAPKSLNMSIKYRDQQKREALIKAVEKYKKETAQILSAPLGHYRSISSHHDKLQSSLDLATSRRMPSLKEKDEHFPECIKKPHSRTRSQVLSAEETIQDIVRWSLSQALSNGKKTVYQHPVPLGQSHRLSPSLSHSRKTSRPLHKKTLHGDPLDVHRQWFTETKKPFTPKVLKTPNKSFLSKYRYYNSPHRKKTFLSDKPLHKNPGKLYRASEDECLRSYADYFTRHPLKKHQETSVSLQALLQAKEEELKYLQFLKEITNDILIRSCYQNKALGDIFQLHVRSRRCDLDEVKMQRIFRALKEDLNNCTDLPDPSISYFGLEHRSRHLIASNM
ncbi:PREDICTED: spermatogenesis-associated protein 7 homolog [Gekko japonicus]|uniref:Spermatogenesis-associated protein 7 homolog n=1 Tax=Gekko japonicus TaxID=146911 RepID=A0ABM1KGW8_GEKJA|nr:PREDICTED: spermatogenesis-associated protein 7 homolog [Gekko japonicus]